MRGPLGGGGGSGKGKGGEGRESLVDVDGPGRWSAPGPALALGRPATRLPVSKSNGQWSGLEADGGIPCWPNWRPHCLLYLQCITLSFFFIKTARETK